jgi:hypothetical protein
MENDTFTDMRKSTALFAANKQCWVSRKKVEEWRRGRLTECGIVAWVKENRPDIKLLKVESRK